MVQSVTLSLAGIADEYPFHPKNIEIRIWFYNPDRSELPLEKIYCVTSLNGVFKYYTRSNPREAIYKENYEEALQKTSQSDIRFQ